MNAVKVIKRENVRFFFFSRARKDRRYPVHFAERGEATEGRAGREERVGGLRDTGYGTDHACEGCFHPPRTRPRQQEGDRGEGGESTHSVHLRCILRKSRTCQAIRISFFIPRARLPPSPRPVDMQPFINTPSSPSLPFLSARFSFALRLVGEAPPSTFLSTASTLSYLALSRNNVDSGV